METVALELDSNAFCQLGAAGLLTDAVGLFGVDLSECVRLPALPHMLRRGKLRTHLGNSLSDELIPMANSITTIGAAAPEWIDRLIPVPDIDPDDAQLLALAAEHGHTLLTDDKRALRAVKAVPEVAVKLSGKVAVLDAVLLALCDKLGPDEVARRIQPVLSINKELKICFSGGNSDPRAGLRSYFENLVREVDPLMLWRP